MARVYRTVQAVRVVVEKPWASLADAIFPLRDLRNFLVSQHQILPVRGRINGIAHAEPSHIEQLDHRAKHLYLPYDSME
jgi:hypothetical protein